MDEGFEAGLSMGENADSGMSGDSDVTGGEGNGKRQTGRAGIGTTRWGLERRRTYDGVWLSARAH